MRVKSILGIVAAALTLVATTWVVATTPAWAAATTPTQAAKGYSRCPQGDVCFFTESNGEGRMCNWYGNDPDWLSGSVRCSWAATTNVKSIYNNGFTYAVVYYQGKHYMNRLGCTPVHVQGNLPGTYKVLSHRWVRHC